MEKKMEEREITEKETLEKEMMEKKTEEIVQSADAAETQLVETGNNALPVETAADTLPAETEKDALPAETATDTLPAKTEGVFPRFLENVKLLPRLITKPSTAGAEFVRRHPVNAAVFALLLHGLAAGFYVLSLFHSLNGMLLDLLLNLSAGVHQGLSALSAVIQDLAGNLIRSLLSIIPEVGGRLGDSLSGAANSGIDYIAGMFSMQVTDFLTKLYHALRLPENFGFWMGFLSTLVQSLVLLLLLRVFLHFARHPFEDFKGSLAALAVRSMIAIPMILISSLIALFNPLIGMLVFGLMFIFEAVYLYSALAFSTDEEHKNRLAILFAFFALLMELISFAAIGFVSAVTGLDVFARLSIMISEIAGL